MEHYNEHENRNYQLTMYSRYVLYEIRLEQVVQWNLSKKYEQGVHGWMIASNRKENSGQHSYKFTLLRTNYFNYTSGIYIM